MLNSVGKRAGTELVEIVEPQDRMFDRLLGGLGSALDSLLDVDVLDAQAISDAAASIEGAAESALQLIERIVDALPGLVRSFLETLAETLPSLIQRAAEVVGDVLRVVADEIGDVLSAVIDAVVDALPVLIEAIVDYAGRERRFGKTSRQIAEHGDGPVGDEAGGDARGLTEREAESGSRTSHAHE